MANFGGSGVTVIYGKTVAGIAAAKAISNMGLSCIITDSVPRVGGLTTGGLSYFDVGPNGSVFGGITKNYLTAMGQTYGQPAGTLLINPEPRTAASALSNILGSSGITVHNAGRPMVSLQKSGSLISSFVAGGGPDTYTASQFIDATYTMDLAAMAGVSQTYGRESAATYSEDTSLSSGTGFNQGRAGFSSGLQNFPFSGLDANGQRLRGVNPLPKASLQPGDAYHSEQTFNFRLCVTSTAAKKLAIAQPATYKASDYTLVANFLASNTGIVKFLDTPGSGSSVFGGVLLASNSGAMKYDINANAIVSSDFVEAGFGQPSLQSAYLNGSATTRTAIATRLGNWLLGLLYWLQNDCPVAALKTDAQNYGLCNDEFTSDYLITPGFSPQIYIRDGRRLVGQYVMTLADIKAGATVSDPIARFNYATDHHLHQRYPWTPNLGFIQLEGGYNQPSPASPYQIPFRSILPAVGQADNLQVPVCLSCSHLAWGALRLEMLLMMLGEAAGYAAALSILNNTQPTKLPYSLLRSALLANGALL